MRKSGKFRLTRNQKYIVGGTCSLTTIFICCCFSLLVILSLGDSTNSVSQNVIIPTPSTVLLIPTNTLPLLESSSTSTVSVILLPTLSSVPIQLSPTYTAPPIESTIPPPAVTVAPIEPASPEINETGEVIIDNIYNDGQVYRVESDEYAVIKNNGSVAVNLDGWRLNAGDPGQDFYFPNFVLEPGQSCRVYTDEIHPESCGFSFGSGKAIWNNDGDCGKLYDSSGVKVDEKCY